MKKFGNKMSVNNLHNTELHIIYLWSSYFKEFNPLITGDYLTSKAIKRYFINSLNSLKKKCLNLTLW